MLAITTATLVVLVLIVVFFPWNVLRGPLANYASHRLGRPVAIGGDLKVKLGFVARVEVNGLTVGNAPWSKDTLMAQAEQIVVHVDLKQLIRQKQALLQIELTAPRVLLEKNDKGEANWRLGNEGSSSTAVGVGNITIDRGEVHYRDPTLPAEITATVSATSGSDGQPGSVQVAANGRYHNEPFTLDAQGLSLAALRQAKDPYQLSLQAAAGATRVNFKGTILPANVQNLQGELTLQGPDLSRLHPLVPAPIPWTPPYRLSGLLAHEDATWAFRGFKGSVGDSDVAGEFRVDLSKSRPAVFADLSSRRFNYKDLGGFVGIPPGEGAHLAPTSEQKRAAQHRAESERVLPNKPFPFEELRKADADVRFRGASVAWRNIPLDRLDAHLVLKDGVLHLRPLDFGIANGHVVSTIVLDTSTVPAQAQADIDVRSLELSRLFPKLASPKGSAGRFSGKARFNAAGNSTASLLASTNGEIALAMRGGKASTLTLVLSNLDLARAIVLLMRGDETSQIRCAAVEFHADQGNFTSNIFVVDTTAENIVGEGSIDFRDERYDLRLKARSKRASPLALRGPIVIRGTFKSPSVRPAVAPLTVRAGAAVALGLIAPPVALLPLIDLGGGQDADCNALIGQAQRASPARPRAQPVNRAGRTARAVGTR